VKVAEKEENTSLIANFYSIILQFLSLLIFERGKGTLILVLIF
jgi:hypothetical protein